MLNSKLFTSLSLVIFFQCCILMTSCGQGYSFAYKILPKEFYPSGKELEQYLTQANNLKKGSYDLTCLLPEDYVKDGSVDYTSFLQKGLDDNRNIIFPNFPVLINEGGLTLASNSVVIFQEKSKIVMAPNEKENYQVLRIFNVENLKLFFPVIEGDRFAHRSQLGEWGMGISIAGSKNIEIINPKISNCWGDGIYFGRINRKTNSDIKIHYAQLDNNRRNGISVVCARNLMINSPVISNTNGTMPMSGIDIEPNVTMDEVDNIKVVNALTFNNAGSGMFFNPSAFSKKDSKKIGVEVIGHIDFYSNNALDFYFGKPDDVESVYPAFSKIKIVNPKWYFNHSDRFINFKSSAKGLSIIINNPSIYKLKNGATLVDTDAMKKFKKYFERKE